MVAKASTKTIHSATRPPEQVARPRLLFLCQTLPFPPDGGVHIRSYNILRLLSQAFEVTALCFYRRATRPTASHVQNGIAGLSELAEVEAFPIPQEHSRKRLVWDHFRSVALRHPYTRYTHKSKAFARRLRSLLEKGDFDLVHMDSLDLSVYLPEFKGIPVVCTHHNIESDLLRRRAPTERSVLLRSYLRVQANLMETEEKRWCSHVALNAVVSESDRQRLSHLVPQARVKVIPNGVDTSMFQPTGRSGRGLVFVGGYSWYPNRDAMAYFRAAILPLLRQQNPDLSITWIGRAPENVRKEYETEHRVRLTGYVDDIRPHVASAACYIVPLRVGGGTRLKILDAWAMGKAVVSTSVGCEGLDARDGENILIRDTPEDFVEAVNAVLRDSVLREQLEKNARATAESVYDWNVIGKSMLREYLQIARHGASTASMLELV